MFSLIMFLLDAGRPHLRRVERRVQPPLFPRRVLPLPLFNGIIVTGNISFTFL